MLLFLYLTLGFHCLSTSDFLMPAYESVFRFFSTQPYFAATWFS